jgi:hypothetical protein
MNWFTHGKKIVYDFRIIVIIKHLHSITAIMYRGVLLDRRLGCQFMSACLTLEQSQDFMLMMRRSGSIRSRSSRVARSPKMSRLQRTVRSDLFLYCHTPPLRLFLIAMMH